MFADNSVSFGRILGKNKNFELFKHENVFKHDRTSPYTLLNRKQFADYIEYIRDAHMATNLPLFDFDVFLVFLSETS
jgi:hypothetical protein